VLAHVRPGELFGVFDGGFQPAEGAVLRHGTSQDPAHTQTVLLSVARISAPTPDGCPQR
jgi:hypothetical protein